MIKTNKTASGTTSLNIKRMSFHGKGVYVPSIFGHRVSLTDFKLTALDRGLKIINPYLAHGDGGHDGVHGDYTYDYLEGFKTGTICDRIAANKPEGLRMFYHAAYDVAMHMYQILNSDV